MALAINSPWTTSGDRRRQVIVVWTDSPAQPLTGAPAPAPYTDKIPKDFSATLAHAVRDPIESELPLVKVPTLVTRGAREPIVPMAWAQAAARLLPRGKLAVVPGSPHNANYSAADHLAELVLTFLFPVP